MLTSEDLEQIRGIAADIQARAVEAMAANLTDLRAELSTRAEADARRLDRIAESLRGIQIQLHRLQPLG
jgi:hypothetical protein